jgi:hypothetical protein
MRLRPLIERPKPAGETAIGYASGGISPKTSSMRSTSLIALALLSSTLLPAQAKPPRSPAKQPATAAEVDVWSETRSRQLFAACDEDSDDSLDLLETCAALDLPLDTATLERFRRLDRNRDGFLDWSEFDRYCGSVVYDGHTLRLWLSRPLQVDDKEQQPAAPATPAQLLLQLFDADHSGDMSLGEFEALLAKANMPPSLASKFSMLDADGSKTLSSKELAPLAGLPNLSRLQEKAKGLPLLPAPYATWDRDANGNLDAPEIAAALRRIDPDLARYAPRVLDHLDRDGDHKVGAAELEVRTPGAGQAVVERSTQR